MTSIDAVPTVFDFEAKRLDGSLECLSKYRGQVLLIVNVASRCGFTGQYTELEQLYRDYASQGFVALGFPCNQFGMQEPGSDESIQKFCSTTYGVTFPMYSKISVNGSDTHPLFAFLKSKAPGLLGSKTIKWNFTKFLVSASGKEVERFGSIVSPNHMRSEIERFLSERTESLPP